MDAMDWVIVWIFMVSLFRLFMETTPDEARRNLALWLKAIRGSHE